MLLADWNCIYPCGQWLWYIYISYIYDSDIYIWYIYISLSICCTRTGQLYINPNDLETLASVLSSISWQRRHWGPGPFKELQKRCQGTCEQCCSCSWSQHSRGSKTTLNIDEKTTLIFYAHHMWVTYVHMHTFMAWYGYICDMYVCVCVYVFYIYDN